MIQIKRSLARQLRAVFRRLAGRVPSVRPVLSLHADAGGLSIRLHRTEIQAEHRLTSQNDRETLTLPLEALSECEGKDESVVTLAASDSTTVSAAWTDRGITQARQFSVSESADLPDFPECPAQTVASSSELLVALAEATKSAADEAIDASGNLCPQQRPDRRAQEAETPGQAAAHHHRLAPAASTSRWCVIAPTHPDREDFSFTLVN